MTYPVILADPPWRYRPATLCVARVLSGLAAAGDSDLDYAPPLAKITAHFLQREHP